MSAISRREAVLGTVAAALVAAAGTEIVARTVSEPVRLSRDHDWDAFHVNLVKHAGRNPQSNIIATADAYAAAGHRDVAEWVRNQLT